MIRESFCIIKYIFVNERNNKKKYIYYFSVENKTNIITFDFSHTSKYITWIFRKANMDLRHR
jgi:hypothetical protein